MRHLCLLFLASLVPLLAEAGEPKRDRFGDPLPEGAVARLGTVHAHPNATGIRYSADGRTIITTSPAVVRHWDAETGRVIKMKARPIDPWEFKQVISEDGRVAATAFEDRIEIQDLENDRVLHRVKMVEIEAACRNQVTDIPPFKMFGISPDGCLVMFRLPVPQDEMGQTFVLRNGRIEEWPQLTGSFESIVFSANGKRVAIRVGGEKSGIQLRNAETGALLGEFPNQGKAMAVSFDGSTLLTQKEGKLLMLESKSGRPSIGFEFAAPVVIAAAAFSEDGRLVAFSMEKEIVLWNINAKRVVQTITASATTLAFSPDSKRLVATENGSLLQWDLANGKSIGLETGPLPGQCLFAPIRGRHVIMRDNSRSHLQVREWMTGKLAFSVVFGGMQLGAWLSPDAALLFACNESVAQVWDIAANKVLHRFCPIPPDLVTGNWKLAAMPRSSFDGMSFSVLLSEATGQREEADCEFVRWSIRTGQMLSRRRLKLPGFGYAIIGPESQEIETDRGTFDARTGKLLQRTALMPGAGFRNGSSLANGRLKMLHFHRTEFEVPVISMTVIEAMTEKALFQTLSQGVSKRRGSGSSAAWGPVAEAISPDGRWLAIGHRFGIDLWDLVEQKQIPFHPPHHTPDVQYFGPSVCIDLVFLGKDRLLGCYGDFSAIVWDLAHAAKSASFPPLSPSIWDDLGNSNAVLGQRAVFALRGDFEKAIVMLRKRMPPIEAPDAKTVASLVEDLSNATFSKRESATKRLKKHGRSIVAPLEAVMTTSTNPEQKNRIAKLLDEFADSRPVNADELRAVRAVQAVEHMDRDEARALLRDWAKGAESAILTREAKASLERTGR